MLMLLLAFTSISATGQQHKLQLLNGKHKLIEKVISVDQHKVTYLSADGKQHRIAKQRLFAEIGNDGQELQVFYAIDTLEERLFTINQMRSYVKGRVDARQGYKNPWSYPTGVVYGLIGAAVIPALPAFAPVPPAVGMVFTSFQTAKVKGKSIIDQALVNDEAYMQGYIEQANAIKLKKVLLGCATSMLAASTYFTISFYNSGKYRSDN